MTTVRLPYFTSGKVVSGFGRGSKSLGIPTANFSDDVVNALPKEMDNGVYYGWASMNGQVYKMVASIGWNPFFKNKKKSLEVHLLHKFSQDFYGAEIKLIITGFLRPQKDFHTVDDLIAEIKNDVLLAEKELQQESMTELKNNPFLTDACDPIP